MRELINEIRQDFRDYGGYEEIRDEMRWDEILKKF